MTSQQPLVVDVVWHGATTGVHLVAEAIFRLLDGDPDGRGRVRTGIPVHFRRLGIDLDLPSWPPSKRRAVVVLLDSTLTAAYTQRRSPIPAQVRDLLKICSDNGWLVLPVALCEQAMGVADLAGRFNLIRAQQTPDDAAASTAAYAVALELHRLLAPHRSVPVFISYASRDGRDLAQGMQDHLRQDTHLEAFLDSASMYPGEEFATILDSHVIDGPVVAMVTDAYAASAWCGREIVLAKQAGQPVVVVDAINSGQERSFPYLGNGPVVRLQVDNPTATFARVVELAIHESLRRTYFPLRVAHLAALMDQPTPQHVLARAPELMTLNAAVHSGSTVVYPDPPVPSVELNLLRQAFPDVQLRTPTEVWA